jgi:hypothetical protein
MTITKDQADAARKLLSAYNEQEWAAGEARRTAARQAAQAIIDEMGFDLTAWAERQRQRDLKDGYGRGMSDAAALEYNVRLAHSRLLQTLEAFDVDAAAFFRLARKETT